MDDRIPSTEAQDFDLDLHQPAPGYTPCGKAHTYHELGWPLTGTISIDKCERQCRFPTCKAWSQTAAALRKHVNAHILNNNLNLRVIPASNGRAPVRIIHQDSPPSIAAQTHHDQSAIASPDGSTLSTYRSDSGYISRRTSSQTPNPPSPSSQKRAVDPSPLETTTKRPRSESFGSMNDHSWSTMIHSRKLDTAGEETRHSNDEGMDRAVYMHRLDTLMAKVQKLRESTLMAREEREREKSPFREGSPLAPREKDPQYLPSVRIATATATHFQELNRPDWGMSPRRVLPDTVSLEMVKVRSYESEGENLALQSTDPSLHRDRPIATVEEASNFDGSFHSTTPQSNLVHPEQQMSTESASPKVASVNTVHEVSSSGWPLHLSATSGHEFPAGQSHSQESDQSFAVENVTSLGEEINYRQNRITCDVCKKNVKNNSELKKHQLRHAKPYICQVSGCTRVEGFSTKNDLDRHARHKHPELSEKVERYRCRFPGCKSADKSWPRLDNFRSHLQRVHSRHLTEAGIEGLVRGAQFDCAVADILGSNGDKPQASPLATHRSEDQLDLQSLHVLADSAVFERYYSVWPHGREQKVLPVGRH